MDHKNLTSTQLKPTSESSPHKTPPLKGLRFPSLRRPVKRIYFTSLLVFCLILAGLVAVVMLTQEKQDTRSKASTDRIDLVFNAQTVQTLPGQTFTLDLLTIPNQHSFAAADIYIDYNPQAVILNQVDLVTNIFPLTIASTSGQLRLALGVLCHPDNYCQSINQTSRLATLTFQAIAPYQSSIIINPQSQATALSDYPVNDTGDLGQVSISIISPSPTPTPFISPTLTPSNQSLLSGTIRDQVTNAVVQSADITATAKDKKPPIKYSTTSDIIGDYSLILDPDIYIVEVNASGYFKTTQEISISSNQTYIQDFFLDPKTKTKTTSLPASTKK